MTQKIIGPAFRRGVLLNGTAVVLDLVGLQLPATVWVQPAAGDTVTVEYRTDDAASWVAWTPGASTAFAKDTLTAPQASVRITRTVGSGTTSAYGIL